MPKLLLPSITTLAVGAILWLNLALASHGLAVSPGKTIPQKVKPEHQTSEPMSRRSCLTKTLSVGSLGFLVSSGPAEALEEKNEILCGTGFFTNIALYKCTEIGDISDEGKSKDMNTQELGSVSSLMDKMGLESSISEQPDENPRDKATGSSH